MSEKSPPPTIAPETRAALLAAATDFAALEPWDLIGDSEMVGLIDPVTGEKRIATVLGNAREVFAAVFYRRTGLRWILAMLEDIPDPEDLNNADGMDFLKVEFVSKRELWKEDLAMLKAAGFKPAGKGVVWPQFRSAEPGWHPWFVSQTEAEQLAGDITRLTAFCDLYEFCPALYDGRAMAEIPFLPVSLPARPLMPEDLDWCPILRPPLTGYEPFKAAADQLAKLRSLKHVNELVCEFDSTLMPGGSFVENGRPCFGRFNLLVETRRGLVIGLSMQSGALAAGEAAGHGLIEALLAAGGLPKTVRIRGDRLQPVLQTLCDEFRIQLLPVSSLPLLEEAQAALIQHMAGGSGA